jgi:hypothetical protein
MDTFEVEEVGLAESRLVFDEEVVDCSNRVFEITNYMLMSLKDRVEWTVLPSHRWRYLREGGEILGLPSQQEPLLYIGNPIRLFFDPVEGVTVMRVPEFRIRSGVQLGY